MDIETLRQYAPKAIATLVGIAIIYVLRQYKRKNDVAAFLRAIYADMQKAAKNENFRQARLADANAEIAKYPTPTPIIPISNRKQVRIAAFPKMLFMSGLTGVVFVYLGLFETGPAGEIWPVYAGACFFAVTVIFYLYSESDRKYYGRVQQLNRKYLMQKAGNEPERMATLREVLEYYPGLSQLWLELGDQYAVEKDYDKAVDAIKKARTLDAQNIDLAVVEVSFQLRRHDAAGAAKALDEAENLKKSPTDPRIAIYRGALALEKNEKKTALRCGKEALELDPDFTKRLIERDSGLKDLYALWEELFRKKDEELLEEVAARQEARKAREAEAKTDETK